MDFEKICMMFTMQEPYYGILLSAMQRIPTDKVNTLGVTRSGNVFKLFYNPAFVGQFDIDTTLCLLKHEVLHVAFSHFSIWDGEDKDDTDDMHRLRNVAADLEVNSYLDRTKMNPKAGGVWAEDFGWLKFEGTREYFSRLVQKVRQQQQAQASHPQKPCNGGMGGNRSSQTRQSPQQQSQSMDQSQQAQGNQQPSQSQQQDSRGGGDGCDPTGQNQQPQQTSGSQPQQGQQSIPHDFLDSIPSSFDDHSMWPENVSDDDTEQMKQIVDDLLVFAAEEVEKSHGTIPCEMQKRIKMIRERKRPKPVADWKRYFRRYLGNEFSEFIRKSKKRESRRFPDAAGNRHRHKSHILVAIDTSGSVSMPEYREFFGQIRTLTATADFHVVECDAMIQHEYDYKGKPNETLHGFGGTDFQPVIDLFNKDRKKYDALVYFTDGYCSIPKDTPKDTLWVISSDGDQSDRNRYRVNGASVAFIPKHTNN